jgi:hypothetical protein
LNVPRVFTVYHCGTGFHRDKTHELVANLATRTIGAENRNWMITDGPGSRGNVFSKVRGVVTGHGWDENVAHTLAVIKADATTPAIGTVNMVGWSRGAITCGMTAHALASDPRTRHLRVNIFAIDPVPGPGNLEDRNKITLPANVDHYTGIVMEDEARKIMKPISFSPLMGAPTTAYTFLPMPGQHNTGVMRTRTEIGLIVAGLAHEFLLDHGTLLRDPIDLRPRDYCELYAKVALTIDDYHKLKGGSSFQRSRFPGLGKYKRQIVNEYANDFFINRHHVSQFVAAFPVISDLLVAGADEDELKEACDRCISGVAPTTYQALVETGVIPPPGPRDDAAGPAPPPAAAA